MISAVFPLASLVAALALLPASLAPSAGSDETSLEKARRGFETELNKSEFEKKDPVKPPEGLALVHYDSPTGRANAYITANPKKGQRHPAIVWLVGGFPAGGATDTAFEPGKYDNDQSAIQFRREGVITLYPSLRGTFGVPGVQESFLGEVDDVLAALDYLRTRDDVDPKRIFLGGHSTGGTLTLLVSEVQNEFRAIFSFGPVARMSDYGKSSVLFDPKNKAEDLVRSPIYHLDGIKTPTFVFEGAAGGNPDSLEEIRDANKNRALRCALIPGVNHFAYIAPLNHHLARAIAQDDGKKAFTLNPKDCVKSVGESIRAQLDARTIRVIASARSRGIELKRQQEFIFVTWSRDKSDLKSLQKSKEANGYDLKYLGSDGDPKDEWFLLEIRAKAKPSDLVRCCDLTADVQAWIRPHGVKISRIYIEDQE